MDISEYVEYSILKKGNSCSTTETIKAILCFLCLCICLQENRNHTVELV